MKKKEIKKSKKVTLPSIQDYLKYVKSESKPKKDNSVGYYHSIYYK